MSGHSKWSTIKRQKGAADTRRGQTFTKIANAITVAAKVGGSSDSNSNPRLRVVLDQARSVNMPKENIQRAIDRGLGKLAGQVLEEVSFEGFGPGKVAYFLEGVTDNKMRTLQEIRNLFERSGGSLASTGATSYMFDKKGEIIISSKGGEIEEEMLELIDLGAQDMDDFVDENGLGGRKYLVYVESPEVNVMSNKFTQVGYRVESAELVLKPNMVVEINNPETAKKVVEFTQNLEGLDDIQKVYTNFNIPNSLI